MPAEALWKGITSVSNAGKKRGRGKTVSTKNIKDLNKGQVIGVGKMVFVFYNFTKVWSMDLNLGNQKNC